jgi:Ca2+-dependent lipid-binding protein, contains C2 domain
LKRKPNAFVQLTAGSFSPVRTHVVKGSIAPIWDKSYPLYLEASSELIFEVFDDGFGSKATLGRSIIDIRHLLELQENEESMGSFSLPPSKTLI